MKHLTNKKPGRRIISLLLMMGLLVGIFPVGAIATDDELPQMNADNKIITFVPLAGEIALQTLLIGGELSDVNLPNSLEVFVEEEAKPLSASVEEWICEPVFEPDTIGTYSFTPTLDSQWSLADSGELPTVTVRVIMGAMPLADNESITPLASDELVITGNVSGYTYSNGVLSITQNGDYTISMMHPGATTSDRIIVKDSITADITLNGVSIDCSGDSLCAFEIEGTATANLMLLGANRLISGEYKAGLQVTTGGELTISAPDTSHTLEAKGGGYAPGIGGEGGPSAKTSCGTVTINNGTINAHTTHTSAGIGGGLGAITGNGGIVTINGGIVIASGERGAGIGGGPSNNVLNAGDGGTVVINGGEVTARSANGGAGIGGGGSGGMGSGSGGTITINGGIVTAIGDNGAGIGGGNGTSSQSDNGNSGNITISGGTISATAGAGSAVGIGRLGSGGMVQGGFVTITGGSISTTSNAAHINPQPTNGSDNLYLNTLTVGSPSIADSTPVSDIKYDVASSYGSKDVVAMNGGAIYLWLPQNSDSAAQVSVDADGDTYVKTWARTAATETETLLRSGNAEVPSISGHPQDAVYDVGNAATALSVTASVMDGGTLSYQWYENTSNSTTGGAAIAGADTASYTPDTGTVGIRYYYCQVTNTNLGVSGTQTATETSNAAAVTVKALVHAETPSISGHPQDAVYDVGNTAAALSVTASVTDGGTLSYQWYENSSNSTTGGAVIAGADTASYTPDTGTVGTRYYYCQVTNTNLGASGRQTATKTSNAAAVTVKALVHAETPSISGHPQDAVYDVGDVATALSVTASVTDGGTLSYQWYENTSNSTTGGAVITGADTASYTPDTGTVGIRYYYCQVTNTNLGVSGTQTATETSNAAAVTVKALVHAETPSISGHPQDAVYDVGNAAAPLSVTASVTDGGTLSYQWYENSSNSTTGGAAIAGADTASYIPDTSTVGTLYYYCQVTNTNLGVSGTKTATETSSAAAVTVKALVHAESPSISGHPQDAVYDVGNAAAPLSVTASVTDGGTLSYQWYENSSNSTTGGAAIAGADTASYTPDTGTVGIRYYYCQVTNTNLGVSGTKTATETSSAAAVTVKALVHAETPSISGHPQDAVYDVGNTAAALSVTASVTDGGTLSYQWYENSSNSTTGGAVIAGADTASYTPDTGTVGTRYYYCQVTNTNLGVSGTQTATETSSAAAVTVKALVHAETPSISGHPQDAVYDVGNAAAPLSVTASVTDGGTLSYQWYENSSNSTTGGAVIAGADTASYTPDTGTVGTRYYYCQVTNTNLGVSGTQTATETSSAAAVTVNARRSSSSRSSSKSPETHGTIRVHQVSVPYTMNSDTGVLTIVLTDSLLNEIAAAAGDEKTITVNAGGPLGLKEIVVNFSPAWFLAHTEVTFEMQSDVGGILLNRAVAEKFPAQNTAAIVSLRTGSLTLSAKQNGNEVTWDQPDSPVTIYMPYTPKKDADTNSIVMYDKVTSNITAHSFYADGKVYGAVAKPGQYEVKVAESEFADVADHWASADIAYVTSRGLVSGTAAATFSPDTAITRADFLTALVKLHGADISSFQTSSFSDVASGRDTMPYIEWAYENKIVEGIGSGRFGPEQPVTREQMAVIMVNYTEAINLKLPELHQAETFADNDSISVWAGNAVEVIQRAGIIAGKPDNRFDPAGNMTRAEASVVLRLFAETVVNGR